MPNWCSNSLDITGPKEKVKALWDRANQLAVENNGHGLLEAMAPLGEWNYDTAVEAWGTKWDISLEGLEYSEDGDTAIITGWFDSAWAPPIEAFRFYATNNDDVFIENRFFEPGMGFVGRFDTADDVDEYEVDAGTVKNIPEDLRDYFNLEDWYKEF